MLSASCGLQAQTSPPMLKETDKPKPAIKQSPPITSPIDDSELKQIVEDPSKGQPDRQRSDGVHGLESGRPTQNGKNINEKDISDKATITRGRYADTFGANRINNANQTPINLGHGTSPDMGYKGMHGNPAGRGDESADKKSGFIGKNALGGKNQWGGSNYALTDEGMDTFAVNDTEQAVISYDKNGRQRAITTYSLGSDSTGKIRTYTEIYTRDGKKISGSTKWPNPEADATAGGVVILPGMSFAAFLKGAKIAGGKAGGAGDGRNPDATTTGGSSEHSGKAIMMGKTGGNEAKQSEGGGTLNMNKVLEINTEINPVRH